MELPCNMKMEKGFLAGICLNNLIKQLLWSSNDFSILNRLGLRFLGLFSLFCLVGWGFFVSFCFVFLFVCLSFLFCIWFVDFVFFVGWLVVLSGVNTLGLNLMLLSSQVLRV